MDFTGTGLPCLLLCQSTPLIEWPFAFIVPEVKTLLDGVTIGGRKISDQEQVLNLATSLNRVFASGLQALQSEVQPPFEKAAAFLLFGALQQFNENRVRFYLDKDATEMMAFWVHCNPDAEQMQGANQNPLVEGRGA